MKKKSQIFHGIMQLEVGEAVQTAFENWDERKERTKIRLNAHLNIKHKMLE